MKWEFGSKESIKEMLPGKTGKWLEEVGGGGGSKARVRLQTKSHGGGLQPDSTTELWNINYASEFALTCYKEPGLLYSYFHTPGNHWLWSTFWWVDVSSQALLTLCLYRHSGSSSPGAGLWRESQVWMVRSKRHKSWGAGREVEVSKHYKGDLGGTPGVPITYLLPFLPSLTP